MNVTMAAIIWARQLGGDDATVFALLPKGARFSFPGTLANYTKISHRSFRDNHGDRYVTGRHTAVIPFKESLS